MFSYAVRNPNPFYKLGGIAAAQFTRNAINRMYPSYYKPSYRKRGRSSFRKAPMSIGMYKRRKYKKGRGTRKSKSIRKDVYQVRNAVKDLRREQNASLGTMIYRNNGTASVTCTKNAQDNIEINYCSSVNIEAALANLRYYDPATPGTLTTADFTSGTYSKKVLIKYAMQEVKIANNYQSRAHVKVYAFSFKDDTSNNANGLWTAGGADNASGTITPGTLNQSPTDYTLFNQMIRTKVLFDGVLQPGSYKSFKQSNKDIEYDPSFKDTETATYSPRYKSGGILVIVKGTICHDSANAAVNGTSAAGVDVEYKQTMKILYQAGVNIKFTVLNNAYDAMTTAVESSKPVADNITYSVA